MKTFYISDEVKYATAEKFYEFCNEIDEEEACVTVTSTGGNMWAATAIVSIMEDTQIKWITYCPAIAMSAGLHIVAHGNERWASKNAMFMYHDGWESYSGSMDKIKEQINNKGFNMRSFDKSFAKRTGQTVSFWEQKIETLTREFYFTAATAKRLGVIDKIGCPLLTLEEVARRKENKV